MRLRQGFKKFSTALTAVLLVNVMVIGFAAPQVARAQSPFVQDLILEELELAKAPKEAVKMSVVGSIFTYLVNLMTFAADRLAYDAAVQIASGGPAEEPLYDGTPVEIFFKQYGAAVAGEAIGSLQEDMAASEGVLGSIFTSFNLCQPRANITIALSLGVKSAFERPTPSCDVKQFLTNWDGFMADIADTASGRTPKNQIILAQLADVFDPQTNELAVGIELQSSILNKALQDSMLKAQLQINNDGYQPVIDFITGDVETPASLIEEYTVSSQFAGRNVRDQVGVALLGNTDALLQVGIHAGSVFTNTLLSEFTKKLYGGLFNIDSEFPDPFADIESIARGNASTARDQYRALLTVTPLEITNYSILAEFSSCPSGDIRGLYNCVANNSFISAIGRAEAGVPMTLEEAVDEGLISGSWPLIPSTDLARNQDPFCYTYGFCHTNLVKLRKARVISVGWELAAESPYNSAASAVTLQEVMDGFDDCNTSGQADANHPWCKLIDPNWVLKYPETQCRAQVNGQLLVTAGIGERQQECVDMPSCIAENDDGTCTGGYGYCVKEENVWRFRGESCPVQFASCLTFEGEDKTVSFLENTVDFGNCTADNAGCLWYDTAKADPEADGTYDWQPVDDIAEADADAEAYKSRVYFTSAVEECDGESGGCRELYSRDSSLRLNVINNPSFEQDENVDELPDAWFRSSAAAAVDTDSGRTGSDAMSGSASGAGMYQPGVAFSQGRFYTLSFYAAQKLTGAVASATAFIAFVPENDTVDVDLNGTSFVAGELATCVIENSEDYIGGEGLGDTLVVSGTPTGTDYQRFTCTFTSPTVADPASGLTATVGFFGDVLVDDVQIEQGEDASAYHEGYSNASPAMITVKVPPAYLGCQGTEDDPEECANYAEVCSENEVGCTAYTPTNGDPTITGVASELDYCPSVCVGYDTFKQEPTLYEPDGIFPVYFIPETGQSCSQKDVGCDEFTNLVTEEREYYTYLRSCVTTAQANANLGEDKAATFYTWEGSDLTGYQLVTWSLLESNMAQSVYVHAASGQVDTTPHLAPCSTWSATADGVVCSDELDSDGDLKKDWDTATCDEHDDIFTNPDCREFYDTNGGIHYRLWSKTVTVNDACVAYRKTEISGIDQTAQIENCANSGGFFDVATGSCRYFGYAEESVECSEAANGCRSYTGGKSRNSRVVLEDALEEGSLNNWDAASAADVTLSNESLATGGHSIAATNQFSTFIFDNGTVCEEGDCEGVAQTLGGTCLVGAGDDACGTLHEELFPGKTYTLSFWAKGSGTLTAAFDLSAVAGAPAAEVLFGQINLTSGWQEFNLGPLNMTSDAYPTFGDDTTLVFDPSDLAYIDNIVLREGEDNITVIKNSWATPAVCDQSPTGAASPQYHLGCQEYNTQNGDTAYLKSFSSLCSEDKVGCEDFFMTQESNSPYAEVFNATCSNPSGAAVTSATSCYYATDAAGAFDTTSQYLCTIGIGLTSCDFNVDWYVDPANLPDHLTYGPATRIVPADSDVFLVVTDDVTCNSSEAGCMEVGKVDWSQDRNSTTGAQSVFLMNDPDRYADILCSGEELFCAAWDTDTDGTYYFKDPIGQTCEYRTDVTLNGNQYDGWFRAGTDEFCYGTCTDGVTACSTDAQCGTGTCNTTDPSYVINGNYSGLWRNGDNQYGGWVGACSSEYSTCSEFQDPLDIQTDQVYMQDDGATYFYLNNENLDENVLPASQRCNGQVSLKEGCALFNDTSEPSQGYSSSASEILSTHADDLLGKAPFSLVNPINCETGANSVYTRPNGTQIDLCAQRCVYDKGLVNDLTDGVTYLEKLDEELLEAVFSPDQSDEAVAAIAAKYGFNDLFVAGKSCYVATDCGTMRSEAGLEVQATNCAALAPVNDADITVQTDGLVPTLEAVPKLENDTNTILKVNRDRECAEWLSCAEDQASWDERTNSWKTVCTDIELCTKYSSLGGSTFCSEWKFNEPELVFNSKQYVKRDVSWYGQEYSGYAIPDLFPVQTLEQANVAPPAGYCDLSGALASGAVSEADYNSLHGDECDAAIDCDPDGTVHSLDPNYCVTEENEDYRLALVAGSCEADYGESCSVGQCANTGAACSSVNDCGPDGGACLVGTCLESSGVACTSDAACGEGEMCFGGTCAKVAGKVTIAGYNNNIADPDNACPDPTKQVFAAHANMKIGSCIREQCILTPDGQTFNVAKSEGKICRGYPETSSPFGYELVEEWRNPDTGSTDPYNSFLTSIDAVPYSTRSTFEGANFCAPGEECECSYRKVTYDSGVVRYLDVETEVDGADGRVKSGVCTSGKIDAMCDTDAECDDDSGDGVCTKVEREDVLLGLEGYCLERDTGRNINGDRDIGACLTWLPVDQLAGSTDLYAKFADAGYFQDTYACTYTAPFVDLKMSAHPGVGEMGVTGDMACADAEQSEITNAEADTDATLDVCVANVTCPAGYWAMMSMPHYDKNGMGTMVDACTYGADGNDCAYVCIPEGATRPSEDGTELDLSCDPLSDDVSQLLSDFDILAWDNTSTTDVKVVASTVSGTKNDDIPLYERFDSMVDALSTCSLKGVELTDEVWDEVFNIPSDDDDDIAENSDEYTYLQMKGEFYAACQEVTQVVDGGDFTGFAWTDRLLGPKTPNTFTVSSDQDGMDFTRDTPPTPYGFISQSPTNLPDEWPLVVAMCENGDGDGQESPQNDSPFNTCDLYYTNVSGPQGDSPSQQLKDKMNPGQALARSFIQFGLDAGETVTTSFNGSVAGWQPFGSFDDLYEIVNQLFASAGLSSSQTNQFQWNPFKSWPIGDLELDRAYTNDEATIEPESDPTAYDVRAEEGVPPKVWSLDLANCVGTVCEEGAENAVTMNDQSSGNIEASGFFRAAMKFYAAADKNQLPLRRVIIDWGDGLDPEDGMQGSDSSDNLYKNHRGLVNGSDVSHCDGTDEWGQTPESCDPNYFSYSHTYVCKSEVIADDSRACQYAADGTLLNSPCWVDTGVAGTENRSCVFQPRLHIRDNWGWCSGVCTGNSFEVDGSEGCFEGTEDTLSLPESKTSECAYLERVTPGENSDPWVYYDGQVIVDPL